MQMFSNAFFVTENIIMILLFYFSQSPHTWYALPVTVCVGSFALLGATMRVTHFCFLTKESNTVETPACYRTIQLYGKSWWKRTKRQYKYKTRTTAAVYRDRSSTSQASHLPLGENFCLKFPSYDTRSDMLSGKFPELRGHSGQYFWQRYFQTVKLNVSVFFCQRISSSKNFGYLLILNPFMIF